MRFIVFFTLILFSFVSQANDNCFDSLSLKNQSISTDLCIKNDLFIGENVSINKNVILEIRGKILGQNINNYAKVSLRSFHQENFNKFTNQSLVNYLNINSSKIRLNHAFVQTAKYTSQFVLLVVFIFLILYTIPFFKKYRIIKKPLEKKQLVREILMGSIGVSITFFVIFYNESFIKFMPFNKIFYNWSDYPWYYHLFSFLCLMFLYDTFFFWLHYLFHKVKFLYKTIHFVHHLSINPNPLTALNFNPIEMIGNYSLLIFCSTIFPVHVTVFQIFFIFHTLFDIYKHSGHQLIPLKYDRKISEWFLIGPNYHEVHHTQGKYHLGFFFPYWDKITKSYNKDWEKSVD